MPTITDPSPELDRLLADLREARFCRGLECPRCRSRHVVRWGSFSLRQRYRCRGCDRTFSDLTGTAAAYTKKLTLWPAYLASMAESDSLRRAARSVGIQLSTSFRWRHAILADLQFRERATLAGWIEIDPVWFPYCHKGQHRRPWPVLRSFSPLLQERPLGTMVLVARDRRGDVATAADQLGPAVGLRTLHVAAALRRRLGPDAILLGARGPMGPVAVYARQIRAQYRDARPGLVGLERSLITIRNAKAYGIALQRWIRRFRGVATKYLPNYLSWYEALDRAERERFQRRCWRWGLPDDGSHPSTLPPNKQRAPAKGSTGPPGPRGRPPWMPPARWLTRTRASRSAARQ